MKTTILLVIDHKKPIADLTDIAAGRIYTLDGVEDVTVFTSGQVVDVTRDFFPRPKVGFWEKVWSRR